MMNQLFSKEADCKKGEFKVSDLRMRHEQLRRDRQNYESHWQEIAERIAPHLARFKSHRAMSEDDSGKPNTTNIYDATPALALQRFSAALASLVTPKSQMWHDVKAVGENLANQIEVREYTDQVRDRLFSARYSANFEIATQECYTDAGCFGNACMYIGERLGRSLYYKHVPLEQVYWASNDYGEVDWVDREFPLTARQAYQRFGDRLPSQILQCIDDRPNQKFWFLHMVFPRDEVNPQRKDYRGMPFASVYISLTGNEIVGEGGFRTMPYAIMRFSGDGNYGQGPCSLILPDVKMLNVMNRDMMQAAELAVMPPMLAAEDGIFSSGFNLTPGAINYGGIDRQSGRQMAIPMEFGNNMPIGMEMMEQKRRIINDALWNTLFQVLVDAPQMTATEAMLRSQEKGALLAPAAARVESEFLEPTIAREIDLLAANSELPEPPEALQKSGGEYYIEYTSPLARYRKTEEAVSIMRAVEQLGVLAQVAGPEVLTRVDFDEASKLLLEVNGVPASVIRSDEEMQAMAEAAAQQQMEQAEQEQQMAEMQNLLQTAPVAARAAKDMAQAQAMAGTVEGMPLPDLF